MCQKVQVFPDSCVEEVLTSIGQKCWCLWGLESEKFRGRHGYWQLVHHHMVGGGDYFCRMGRAGWGLWEPVYGGHTEMQSSKDIKQNLIHKFKLGSRFSRTLCKGQKEGEGKRFRRSISQSQGSILFNRRTMCVHQIKAEKEEYGFQGAEATIQQNWTRDDKNEKLCHQAKCDSIFYIYTRNFHWAVLWEIWSIHKFHLSAKALLTDQGIGSL